MDKGKMNEAVRKALKRLHYPIEVMLVCVRRYAAYPLSLRQLVIATEPEIARKLS